MLPFVEEKKIYNIAIGAPTFPTLLRLPDVNARKEMETLYCATKDRAGVYHKAKKK